MLRNEVKITLVVIHIVCFIGLLGLLFANQMMLSREIKTIAQTKPAIVTKIVEITPLATPSSTMKRILIPTISKTK